LSSNAIIYVQINRALLEIARNFLYAIKNDVYFFTLIIHLFEHVGLVQGPLLQHGGHLQFVEDILVVNDVSFLEVKLTHLVFLVLLQSIIERVIYAKNFLLKGLIVNLIIILT